MNYQKLQALIDDSGITMTALSEKMGITRPTLFRKLKQESVFTVTDINSIRKIFRLTDEETIDIFLS